MIVVTGGAGFIGSCVVRTLNDMGEDDILIVDNIADTDKWKNIRNKKYREYVHKKDFLDKLKNDRWGGIKNIIHLGACSSTTERNFDYLWKNNFEYTKELWNYCTEKQISFIYASSAATYGDGGVGFDDNIDIDRLSPLNAYGYSKQIFDQWVKHQAESAPYQNVGLKFFNVYGPNEYYKGTMASMIFHGYNQIRSDGEIRLFKSYNQDYRDGEQLRDFVYVKDICEVISWMIDHPAVNGLYNLGTGRARTFKDLAEATFSALGLESNIKYIEMPDHLKQRYQYYTKAEMGKLKSIGYIGELTSLEDGVRDYVQSYLSKEYETY